MFGFVQANIDALEEAEKNRYKQFYCGVCHTLGDNFNQLTRLGLTYDMTFLAMLLSSLYEPEEAEYKGRCLPHPVKQHQYIKNSYTEYAADMTVALVYFKCIDDWKDDKKLRAKGFEAVLSGSYKKVKEKYPVQCGIIEKELGCLNEIEKTKEPSPDAAANCFGRLMTGLFVVKDDNWKGYLAALGYNLGRYIYLADAAIDLNDDIKTGSYNPFKELSVPQEDLRPTLQLILGQAAQSFEALPLVQDINILRNILYSGIWCRYNIELNKQKEKNNGQRTT